MNRRYSHTLNAVLRAMRRRTVADNHATVGRFTSCGLASCVRATGCSFRSPLRDSLVTHAGSSALLMDRPRCYQPAGWVNAI